jgi:hypothetical protein
MLWEPINMYWCIECILICAESLLPCLEIVLPCLVSVYIIVYIEIILALTWGRLPCVGDANMSCEVVNISGTLIQCIWESHTVSIGHLCMSRYTFSMPVEH